MEVTLVNENVSKVLAENLWYVATFDKEPNTIPVSFKDITEDGKLVIANVFLETTLVNIGENGRAAVSTCNPTTMEGYQIKGAAEYLTEGSNVDAIKAMVQQATQGALTAKGAVVITPEKIIVTTPGGDNKKEL